MQTTVRMMLCAASLCAFVATATAQDANVTRPVDELEKLMSAEPLVITQAQISRPKAKGDITMHAEVSFGGAPPLGVKLRKAEPGADSFNNVPRYDAAAYELQKLFLDPEEYVVPPTTLRMVPLEAMQKYSTVVKVEPTFRRADQVLAVLQYWLSNIKVIADVYNPDRFAADALYARHIGQLNILTYLINHRDSNAGNFMIGTADSGARVFSIDNGVAFGSADADRGELWKVMRVNRLPADAVEKLRKVSLPTLQQRLGVLAQWRLAGKHYVPVAPGANLSPQRGVRNMGDDLQMGLTSGEINAVHRLLTNLLEQVDRGKITVVPAPAK